MRTFNVLLEIQAAIGLEAEEGPDDGGGGDLVDQAAKHLMGLRQIVNCQFLVALRLKIFKKLLSLIQFK